MTCRQKYFVRAATAIFIAAGAANLFGANILVPTNSVWKYLDDGSDQGVAWRGSNYSDLVWRSGKAQLGYEDGDENTLVSYGSNAANKYVTTYFRHKFSVQNTQQYASLQIGLLRDDGGVVYLNGREVFRGNMPETNITYQTLATSTIGEPEESTFYYKTVLATNLVRGTNVIAVEIHQAATNSSDLSFDLSLTGATEPAIVRGPYLQAGGVSNGVVRWRTDVATTSRVRYGTKATNLAASVTDTNITTEHIVRLKTLKPSTKYFYSIGATNGFAVASTNFFFVTSPPIGTPKQSRLWVLGDSGTADTGAAHVRDAYLRTALGGGADLCLMLGDNAYSTGSDDEYQAAVFDMYPTVLQNMWLWPTIGNHDSAFSRDAIQFPYLDIFSLPTGGESGGLASGSEKYYSFDYANIHLICLDSMTSDVTPEGPMLTWLNNDLAATTQDWVIAYFHHPPYTKGSHDSDREWELTQVRTNIVPVLEAGGADLILCGHSHSYERSYLLNGHYGLSSTLVNSMKINGGDGRTNGAGAYRKSQGVTPNEGTVYAVAGSSGHIEAGTLDHPAMYVSMAVLGSMIIDVHSNRLDAYFMDTNSVALDQFTIIKGGGGTIAAPTNAPVLAVSPVSNNGLLLQWSDSITNESGYKIERSTNGSSFAQVGTTVANMRSDTDSGLQLDTTYFYRVRAFNRAGDSPYSNIATGRVVREPNLTSAKIMADGSFRLLLDGYPNAKYVVERSTNLLNWAAVTIITNGTNPVPFYYSDSGTKSAPRRFYRARVLP